MIAVVHSITVYLPQSALLLAVLGLLGVLVIAKVVSWLWSQIPFV